MSNIDKYTSFIAEQVRKSSVLGLRSQSIDEAEITAIDEAETTENKPLSKKTAAKHERASLEKHLGGSFQSGQHGRGPSNQHVMRNINKSADEVHKTLTGAGYKRIAHENKPDQHKRMETKSVYRKKDEHGHDHTVYTRHSHNSNMVQHDM